MKFTWKKALPVIATLFITAPAFAGEIGLEVEPYIGYSFMGSIGSKNQFDNKIQNDYTMLPLGLRANIKFLNMFYVAPDFVYHQGLTGKINDTTALNPAGLVAGYNLQFGVVAGAELPMNFRVWVGYNFIDSNNGTVRGTLVANTAVNATVNNAYSGSSWKFGVGYKVLPMVNLNLEYLVQSYSAPTTTVSNDAASTTVTNSISAGLATKQAGNNSANMVVLTASIPLSVL